MWAFLHQVLEEQFSDLRNVPSYTCIARNEPSHTPIAGLATHPEL